MFRVSSECLKTFHVLWMKICKEKDYFQYLVLYIWHKNVINLCCKIFFNINISLDQLTCRLILCAEMLIEIFDLDG